MLSEAVKTIIDSNHIDLISQCSIINESGKLRTVSGKCTAELPLVILSHYLKEISKINPIILTDGFEMNLHCVGLPDNEQRIFESTILDFINYTCHLSMDNAIFAQAKPFYERDLKYGPLSSKEYFKVFQEKITEDALDIAIYYADKFDIKPDAKKSARHIADIQSRTDIIMDSIEKRLYMNFPEFYMLQDRISENYERVKEILSPSIIH